MYIFTTLEFPTHKIDFHLLTASVNAKYYYLYTFIFLPDSQKQKKRQADEDKPKEHQPPEKKRRNDSLTERQFNKS